MPRRQHVRLLEDPPAVLLGVRWRVSVSVSVRARVRVRMKVGVRVGARGR